MPPRRPRRRYIEGFPTGPGTLMELCDNDVEKARALQRSVVRYGFELTLEVGREGGFLDWLAAHPGVSDEESLAAYEQLVPAEIRAAAEEHYREWQRRHGGGDDATHG